MCTVLVTQTVAHVVSVGELAWFLMCTVLVTQIVACLVLECELAYFLMCTLLETPAYLVSACELAWL